jgi:hypothetical protein
MKKLDVARLASEGNSLSSAPDNRSTIMRRKPIRSQWVYSVLVNRFPETSPSPRKSGVRDFKYQRLRQMVLETLYGDFNPPETRKMPTENRQYA